MGTHLLCLCGMNFEDMYTTQTTFYLLWRWWPNDKTLSYLPGARSSIWGLFSLWIHSILYFLELFRKTTSNRAAECKCRPHPVYDIKVELKILARCDFQTEITNSCSHFFQKFLFGLLSRRSYVTYIWLASFCMMYGWIYSSPVLF